MINRVDLKPYRSIVDGIRSSLITEASENTLIELHGMSHTMHLCAKLRAENVAKVPLQVVNDNGKPIKDHFFAPIFAKTSNYMNVAMRTELALYYTGSSLSILQPNSKGTFDPFEDNLRWINPLLWELETTGGTLNGFDVYSGRYRLQRAFFVDISAGLYETEIDLEDDFDGIATAQVAFRAARAQVEKWETVQSYMENRAIPASILQPAAGEEASMAGDPEAPKELRAILRNLFKGAKNAGRTLVSPFRLDHIKLQQDFDQLALEHLSPDIRKAIAEASQIPEELLSFTASTHAQAQEAIPFWQEHWLKPRVEWRADFYSRKFTQMLGEPVRVEPDWSGILKMPNRSESTARQVNTGYLSLYDAQIADGLEANSKLKDIYIVKGEPMHIDRIVEMATKEKPEPQPIPPQLLQANNPQQPGQGDQEPPPEQPDGETEADDDGAQRSVFVPDSVWREIQTAARRGLKYRNPEYLDDYTFAYIRSVHESGVHISEADLTSAAKRIYSSIKAAKAIRDTRRLYEQIVGDLLNEAVNRNIERRRFTTILQAETERFIRKGFLDGLVDGGVMVSNVSEDDEQAIADMVAEQRAFARNLSEKLYADDAITADEVAGKPAMWFNKAVYPAYIKGLESATKNGTFEWFLGKTEKHCKTCSKLAGQIHRLADYVKRNLVPKSDALECKGYRCECRLIPRPGARAQGRFPKAA